MQSSSLTSACVELLADLYRWCSPHDMPQSLPATQRLALPVSKITSNDCGGVPISTWKNSTQHHAACTDPAIEGQRRSGFGGLHKNCGDGAQNSYLVRVVSAAWSSFYKVAESLHYLTAPYRTFIPTNFPGAWGYDRVQRCNSTSTALPLGRKITEIRGGLRFQHSAVEKGI